MVPVGAKVAILCGMTAFAAAMLWEVWRWTRRRRSLAVEQFWRRMAVGVVLEIDLLMWLFLDAVVRPGGRVHYTWFTLAYLSTACLLVFVPPFLAIQEMKFVARQYARWRKEIVRNLARPGGPENGDASA
ncbi:MAG: hypothetical protein HY320_12845 [Armatimonadetes bacterium]|nr:hypothetical protein [Armatimonadota bacterium]